MSRVPTWLLAVAFVVWMGAAGVVLGACLLGVLGPDLFGSLGGHGLGDIGYVFHGAEGGLALGLGTGLLALRATPKTRAIMAATAGLLAALVAGLIAALDLW